MDINLFNSWVSYVKCVAESSLFSSFVGEATEMQNG